VSVWRDASPQAGGRWGPSRYTLAGAALAALVVAAAVAAVGIGSTGHRRSRSVASTAAASTSGARARGKDGTRASTRAVHRTAAEAPAHAGHRSTAATASTAAASTAGGRRLVAEVRDPEEARSYPAPPSVRHSAARTPQAAGEIQVATGAASDAEIRKELAKVKALEEAARQPGRMATVPGGNSIVGNDGTIAIPSGAPEVIQRVIAGANAIANFPYVYGGGHASFVDKAYDCSGSVSYALAAGGLLSAPETSGQLESWGAAGPGRWITVYANAGHTYMYVNLGGAWMLYDTAGRSGVFASRWQPYPVDNSGYVARHWPGL
jgi:cell wall-associated NlpC family hydrolase